ncbi:PPPDE putative peptidase domain-containing protein [Suillus fuscotomentosus]|uniref:PPPDE putative peptidase domain-containing protein n=1 Tax=Suillus fuscotomentosus TaxID=1912939 RepID=A0AAD4E257_9AGAM|nr:PPPDE putative peptidase domain-containing protein [Suillus fuscotomentosus]KAG1898145.1 PPPDE putative peptidase domain-containing protein [Suillus fuscotomentosus]
MSSPVKVYVYDLSKGLAGQVSLQLTGKQIDGVWHTSVVAFGKEIFYGLGICETEPGRSHHGSPLRIVDMGETHMDEQTFVEYLSQIKEHYTADKYHLLDFNCNSFTNDCLGFLTGGSLPPYIKDLPSDFLSTPFGAALRPTIDAMFRGRASTGVLTPPPDISATANSPNPASASSLLQAVAAGATSNNPEMPSSSRNYLPTPAPTSPPTPVQGNSLITPVHIATNPSSFRNVLHTHRAVVAFFTSATCGPCRMIEPVFEDLAKSKSRANDVAFVKIDLSVGMSNAVGGEYGVRVTPTFILFLDGNKTHEMKGINAPELRTQVDLLLYQAFPPHPHTTLSLPAIEAIPLNAILSSQVPNLDIVLAKVTGFIDAAPSWSGSTTKEATKQILAKNIIPYLKARGSSSPPNISFEPWKDATISLATNLSAGELFPVADMWRVALLEPAVCSWSATKVGPESPILVLLSKAESAPRNYSLTLLRMISNAFANKIVARELLLSSRSSTTALMVAALFHDDATVRLAAVNLAFNMTVHLQRLRVEKVRGNVEGDDVGENEDWDVEMISALLEVIEREKASEEIVHRLTASLALLIRLSPSIEQFASLLEVLQAQKILKDKLERGGCGDTGVVKKEARKLIEEVAEKLCP